MAVGDQTEQNYLPKKKKSETEDDKRRKKIVPGSLLKAVVRPGGGDSSPVDGDQVNNFGFVFASRGQFWLFMSVFSSGYLSLHCTDTGWCSCGIYEVRIWR
jgi:hypothetical protein